ncbi:MULTISPECIES: ABC transporter permease [Inquilinus]|uniref:Peptide/nickel transport system permease protein n=1 Tax=Inquilinus ginsengisoli TaxID=363840 RepID=A0ABU1JPU5_9PROT|nr:ABC transporter permease [Inquilinus ginsengisoli]MDR6290348.1 peptide/nickel transport system permease protein [Inquilinus ginsengisoli]
MTATVAEPNAAETARRTGNRGWRRFRRHRLAMIGVACILLLVLACVAGPWLLPFDDLRIDMRARFAPPLTGWHLFGTDPLGRDLCARLLMAGRISLSVAFAAMVISTLVGSAIGVVAGYYGRAVGAVLMRLVDAMLCFPAVFLLLTLAALLKPDPITITLIIAATSWMEVARVVESQIRTLRERDFTLAAEMMGASDARIMVDELLRNAVGPIVVAATLTVARAILMEAYISFLGYGIQPPTASWGNMLNNAQQYLTSAPWLALVPGIAITLAVASFNFIGDGLRDALDARLDS